MVDTTTVFLGPNTGRNGSVANACHNFIWTPGTHSLVPAMWALQLLSPFLLVLSNIVKEFPREERLQAASQRKRQEKYDCHVSADYKMTVMKYCGQILYNSWKETKKKSTSMERNFIQNKFCMITASTVFIKNHTT